MSKLALLAVAALTGLTATACSLPPSQCGGTGTVTHRDLRYAQSPGVAARLQSLDLYLPVRKAGCGPAPLVVYVHGGSYVTGSKSNNVADKIRLFNDEGWAFASIEYRLVGDEGAGATNGVYPAQPQDIAAALGFLAGRAGTYALDRHRILLMGHSAGAFLVALVATDGSFAAGAGLPLSDLVCTAPLDTETFSVADQIAGGGNQEAIHRLVFGDDPAVWDRASPIENVEPGRGIGDFLLVTRGSSARLAGNQRFQFALEAAGSSAGLVRAAPLTHPEVNDAVGKPGDQIVTPPLMAFFRGCVV